ncbi:MAG: hypothetical protein UR12_C0035G0004 [candidate division TM6 bacterium GW2011_GWF2_30_66]|nr:MAG: hypothetical protein UR12_C0035G0004 [candidate division TM6 bacterium GW2011_GWF2_30_66]
MDDKKINKLEEKIDGIESKIDKQGERISKIEKVLFQEKETINQESEKVFEQKGKEVGIDFKKLELNLGKYIFQIIGVAIFLLGMGFLFKFAIEKGWFGPMARVIAGFVAATGLIVAGEIIKKKQWSFGFVAGGVVLYYISTYAAHSLYGLIDPGVTFIIFTLITILAFVLSLLHNSRVIAYFSLFGGFLAPLFLTKTGFYFDAFEHFNPDNFLLVMSYLFLISFAFVILALVKRWGLLAFGLLYFMYLYFYCPMIKNLDLNYQILNITIFYFVMVLLPYVYSLIFSKEKNWLESWIIIFGGFASFILYEFYLTRSLSYKIDSAIAPIRWLFAGATQTDVIKYLLFIFGFIFLIKTIFMFIKNKLNNNLLSVLVTLTILQFFAVIMMHFKRYNLSMVVMAYAVLILGISFIIKNYYLRVFTGIFVIIVLIVYIENIFKSMCAGIFSNGSLGEFKSLIYNDLNLATAVLIILFGGSAYLANRYKLQLEGSQKRLPEVLESGIYFTIFIWLMSPLWVWPYKIVAIAAYSIILFYFGLMRSKNYMRIYAYFCFVTSVIMFLFNPKIFELYSNLSQEGKIAYYNEFNLICVVFIFVIAGYMILLNAKKYGEAYIFKDTEVATWMEAIAQKTKFSIEKLKEYEVCFFIKIYELLLCFFAFFCVGRNLYLITENAWYNVLAISVYYGIASLFFIFIGLLLKRQFIRIFGVCISVLTLWKLWFFVMGMTQTASRIIVFIVIGLIFMLASFIYQKLSRKIF